MKIQLVDRNEPLITAWKKFFANEPEVTIYQGDFFDLPTDCVVSPANSFGYMDGGLDLVISKKLGWQIQQGVQHAIKSNLHGGELLVGDAVIVQTHQNELNVKYCIVAPTMRYPSPLGPESVNAYLATRAIFRQLKRLVDVDTITISGLGTGVGGMRPNVCAAQMYYGFKDFWHDEYKFPKSFKEISIRNLQLLDLINDISFI